MLLQLQRQWYYYCKQQVSFLEEQYYSFKGKSAKLHLSEKWRFLKHRADLHLIYPFIFPYTYICDPFLSTTWGLSQCVAMLCSKNKTRWKHLFEDYFSATFLPNLLSLCLNHVFWLMQSRKKNRRPFPLLSFKNGKTASSFSRNWRVQMRFSCFSIYGTLTFVIWCMSTLVGLTVYVCLPYDLDPLSFKSDVMCPEKKTIEDCQNKSRPPWWYA